MPEESTSAADLCDLCAKVRPFGRRRVCEVGEVIIAEGSVSETVAFIEEGLVEVVGGPERRRVSTLGPGEVLGEVSYFDRRPHSAAVLAAERTVLLVLDRAQIEHLHANHPHLGQRVADVLVRALTQRLRRTTSGRLLLDRQHQVLREAQTELIREAQMASLGRLTAGVAHELNNPVAALIRGAEQIQSEMVDLLVELEALPGDHRARLIAEVERAFRVGLQEDVTSASDRRKTRRVLRHRHEQLSNRLVETLARLSADGGEVDDLLNEYGVDALEPLACGLALGGAVRTVSVCARRAAATVRGLRSYARLDQETVAAVDLRQGLEDTLTLYAHELRGLELVRDYDDVPEIQARPAELNQVWSNLVSNALRAMAGEGCLTLGLSARDQGVLVSVEDTGCGIPSGSADRVFELHFTTPREGREFGLGIGLTLVRSIVDGHGGKVRFDSRPGRTRFEVWLPRELNEPTGAAGGLKEGCH